MDFPQLLQRHQDAGITLVSMDTDVPFQQAAFLKPLWESKPAAAREATAQIKATALMSGLRNSLYWMWIE